MFLGKYKTQNSFYSSKQWRALRDYKLTNNPLCEHCQKKDIINSAQEVDHIIPLNVYQNSALDYNNLQSLCRRCHIEKTRQDISNYHKRKEKKKGKLLNLRYDLE